MIRSYFIGFIFLQIVLLSGCSNYVSIKNFNSEAWKLDKMGCNGERSKMSNVLKDAQKQLTGLKKENILMLFGKPEATELHAKGQLLYRYHITPAKNCGMNQSGTLSEMLEIRINALGIVSEAHISFLSNTDS